MQVLGLLPYASNATFLARLTLDGAEGLGVYKPRRGETPLWDFPMGTLCLREHAAWIVDDALGWGLVPATVLRDGPAGFGALQWFVDVDPDLDVSDVVDTHADDLRRIAAFDVLINNADRKAGHCLVGTDGRLWAVDHGVSFHPEPKLRTVIWGFQGEPLPGELARDVERLLTRLGDARDPLAKALADDLSPRETDALAERCARLVRSGRFPTPGPGRHVPWPPW